jgi:thioredoxin-like negative regulator of GroEL
MTFQSIGPLVGRIVTNAAVQIDQQAALLSAHEAAETFHAETARAMRLQQDIEELEFMLRHEPDDASLRADLARCQAQHRDALNACAVALGKMPAPWQAILAARVAP